MLHTIRNAFKIKEIRRGLFFTFLMLIVIRFGSLLPAPYVNTELYKSWFSTQLGDAFNFFNALTGGSFETMSVLALSITPYINSSIIMQLLTIAIPALEEMHKDGEEGRKKIQKITRYLTIGLALLESTAMAIGFERKGYLTGDSAVLAVITVVITLSAGSVFLMWIGERITEKGVGNGISIVLLINIVSRIPSDISSLYEQFVSGKKIAPALLAAVIIIAIILAIIIFVIILQDAERRLPVQYSKKMVGRKQYGGQSSHIPLKVNTAGVIPVIFASSLMQFPVIIASFFGKSEAFIFKMLSTQYWCNFKEPIYSIGLLIYILLVIFFAYFYTSITFNPLEVANNMKKNGGFIPGIRPGKPTSDYLHGVLNCIIFIGVIGLVIVAVVPIFFNGVFAAQVSFGGTSLIIIVGVILETLKQIESRMQERHYKGFLGE